MAVVISMLRAVNLARHQRVAMEPLKELYTSIRLRDPQTYVQSGNVIFKTDERDLARLAKRIEDAIERRFGFRSDVILRTAAEMSAVVAKNPFAKRKGIEPNKLLVSFLVSDPGEEARKQVREIKNAPEEMWIDGRELFIYYPAGMGRSKLPMARIQKALNTPATARNWNSVTKMLEIARTMENLTAKNAKKG
jgi:uncharacterized protein (DUF1697 family)